MTHHFLSNGIEDSKYWGLANAVDVSEWCIGTKESLTLKNEQQRSHPPDLWAQVLACLQLLAAVDSTGKVAHAASCLPNGPNLHGIPVPLPPLIPDFPAVCTCTGFPRALTISPMLYV